MIQQHVLAVLSVSLAFSACGAGLGKGGGASAPASGDSARAEASRRNPFLGVNFFVNPEYAANVEMTAKQFPSDADAIRKVKQYPTGLWLDSIAKVASIPKWLDQAKQQQQSSGQPTLSLFVVYDMPNRDCASKSSAGELKVAQNGAARYRTEFIDPIAAHFRAYPDLPIVVILEPDSLANLVTNLNLPTCEEARDVYVDSSAYAIQKLGLPNVSIYLDAAHAGWLGWDGTARTSSRSTRRCSRLPAASTRSAGSPPTCRTTLTSTTTMAWPWNPAILATMNWSM